MSDRDDERDKEKGFTVSDKRRFVIGENGKVDVKEGEEVKEAPPTEAQQGQESGPETKETDEGRKEKKTLRERIKEKMSRMEGQEDEERAWSEDQPMPEINFMSFILSLSTSVMMHFGEVPDPVTKKQEQNLQLAKQTIDLLGLLEEKTRGNLNDEEKRFMESMLFDLRVRYVEYTEKKASPDKK